MKRTAQILLYIGMFLVSFLVFLYLTFPYEVLKETVAAELSKKTGYDIQIGAMGPDFPLGMTADDIRVASPGGMGSLSIGHLGADVGVLPLFVGDLSLNGSAASGGGAIDLGVDMGLFDLMGGTVAPKAIHFQADGYPVEEAVQFGLGVAANSRNANPMVAPLLSAIGVTGSLHGTMDMSFNAANPTQSTGQAEVQLKDAVLKINDPSLGVSDQKFKKALIKAQVKKGVLNVNKDSGFVSNELELRFDGNVELNQALAMSQLDLQIVFQLNEGLRENFGFVVNAMSGGGARNGKLTMELQGPMARPQVSTF